jgi:3-deoxy-D-manno-octulosonic-acid transferase
VDTAIPTPDGQQPKTNRPSLRGASRRLDVLYAAAGVLLTPYFVFRRIKGKRSARFSEKLGGVAARSAGKQRIWIHAVSVGEAQAAEPLAAALKAALPDADLVFSTTTVTGQEVARKRFGAENVVYYPHDFSFAVKRFLDRVRPTVIVLMELEVWPNLTAEAAHRGIPILVANGRITERSSRRYRRFWQLAGPAFHRVTRWLAQSEEYAARLKALGVDPGRIEICGNIKYDAIKTRLPDAQERTAARAALRLPADATILLGGSTHPTEEAVLLAAYQKLRGAHPSLRLVLTPRHPERGNDVAAEINAAGLGVVRRTEIQARGIDACIAALAASQRETWVLLIDTVGELGAMYALSDLAFVGGSLIPHGGQNVMEPCGIELPIVHGPHMHNFREAMELLRGCNGSMEVMRETLAPALQALLRDPAAAHAMGQRARQAFLKQQGATAKTVEYIRQFITKS